MRHLLHLLLGLALLASPVAAQNGFLPGGQGTVQSNPDTTWPNDPASHGQPGWSVLSDQGWTAAWPGTAGCGSCLTAVQGFAWQLNSYTTTVGNCQKVVDATAPGQGAGGWIDSILLVTYDSLFVAGVSPCTPRLLSGAFTVDSIYVGIWFKHSSNWFGEASNVNKIIQWDQASLSSYFLMANVVGNGTMYMKGQGEPDSNTVWSSYNMPPGPAGTYDTTQMLRNVWHQAEMEWVLTSPNAATVDYWLDGLHQYHCTPALGASCNSSPIKSDTVSNDMGANEVELFMDWGGGGDTVKVSGGMTLRVSHIRVSGK